MYTHLVAAGRTCIYLMWHDTMMLRQDLMATWYDAIRYENDSSVIWSPAVLPSRLMKPLVVRQPMPELTPPKLHLKDNASDEDYGDYDDNSRDGVHDHTQNCEMSDFHIWILKKMLRNKLDPFLRKRSLPPRRSSVANAGGRPFCQELGMGWVHIGQWIFSISAISHALFWRNCVFCVFTL